MKKQWKTSKNIDQYGMNHFIEKEDLDVGKNDGRGDFRLRMPKNHASLLRKKSLKERIGKGTVRVSREKRASIEVICKLNIEKFYGTIN